MATWADKSKNTSTFTDQAKTSGLFYLLQEISDYILLEDGSRIKLQGSIDWSGGTKHTSTFTNQSKS